MEQNGEDQLQIKQDYLKAEIIDKNLEPSKFLEFCTSQKENGDDLNNWTFEELKTCVKNFNESLNKEIQQKQSSSLNFFLSSSKPKIAPQPFPQNQPYPYQMPNQPYQNQYNPQFQQYQQYQPYPQYNPNAYQPQYNPQGTVPQPQVQQGPALIQSVTSLNPLQLMISNEKMQQKINTDIQEISLEYVDNPKISKKYEIICKKIEKNSLNDKDVKVKIQNPKTSEKSLLSTQYTIYEVFTESMNWLVSRRYSDFDWLRTTLCKFFPRILIPPIPGKKVGNRRFEEDFIEKRMKFLQIFIDEIMKNETLKSSEALYSFLTFSDRVQFERKMKELNSIIPSVYCEDLKTIDGKVTILNDDFNENFYVNVNNFFKLQYQILTRLNYNLKNFFRNMTVACMNLEEVQKDLETLSILNTKVKMKESINKTYEELNIFFKNWKRILFNENVIIKEEIKHFFKSQKMENLAFIELIDSREVIRQKYVAEKTKLDAKKEKLYKIMDFNKWEIEDNFNQVDRALLFRDKNYAFDNMCTRETQALENIHKQLGYANYMNNLQLKNIIDKNATKFVQNTKEFANKFYPSLNDGITIWSSLNTYA